MNDEKKLNMQQLCRSQTPQGLFNYIQEEVHFSNGNEKITLSGILTLPRGAGPFPTVVLIAGMGPHDRDYTMIGHKLFLVLADYLTKHGIAVLRYDKRGVGKSSGAFSMELTSQDFAEDVKAAIQYLQSRSEVNKQKIGLIGHSEGGLIAHKVAAQSSDVAFVVSLAPGLRTKVEDIVDQMADQLRADGASLELIKYDMKIRKQLLEIIKAENDLQKAVQPMHEALAVYWQNLPSTYQKEAEHHMFAITAVKADALIGMFNSAWYRFLLNSIPCNTLNKISVPLLALYGNRDFISTSSKKYFFI